MKAKLNEYEKILKRLDKAEVYFKTLEDSEVDSIESSKAYLKMVELIHRANELYIDLRESNINV